MSAEPVPPLSAKTTRRGRRAFLDRWFEPIQVPKGAAEELHALSARGSLVFVMRSSGLLNFLYLRWLLLRLRLPLLRSAANFSGFWGWVARIRRSRHSLLDAASRGRSVLVFLGRPDRAPDPFEALASLQRTLRRPLLLVPLILVWSRRAQKLKPSLWDILFGSPEAPSTFATAVAFLRHYRRAVLRVGRPLELQAFVAERAAEPDEVLGRKVRGALYHHLTRELRAALGPPLKAPARVREKVLRDRGLRQVLEHVSRARGKPIDAAANDALRDLREIASRYSPAFVGLLRPLLGWFFNRRFERLELDEEGLARVRQAAGEAPLVLCPSHRSHVDYLVLSYVFYENGMTPPHVAAGVNLAFWPFGDLARRGGAFFIRRTFKGDKIYSATLRAYVKHLMRDGFVQEFFPEGGRSRTGKLLFLKTGLFSMEVDAWLDGAAEDVLFVPIAVDYEELLETKSLLRELSGGEKKKESFRALLGLPRFLVRRYGRIYIQFEEPISLRALAQQRLGEAASSLTLEPEEAETDSKRSLVRALSNRVAYGINRAITITPVGLVAAALLSHVRRGVSSEAVSRRVELLRYVARDSGARFASGLAGASSDPCAPGPVADAVATLVKKGLVRLEKAAGQIIYQVPDDKRPQLDISRNNVIHRFVAPSLIAAALRASGEPAPLSAVRDRARWLSRLFKLEFMYRVGATFETIFSENVAFLERLGIVSQAGDALRAGAARDMLDFVADLTRPYLETYRLAAETLQAAAKDGAPMDRRSLIKDALERGRAAFFSGRIALRESISKATLENAAEWFSQQGALSVIDGRWTLAAEWKERLLPELLDEMDRHLRS